MNDNRKDIRDIFDNLSIDIDNKKKEQKGVYVSGFGRVEDIYMGTDTIWITGTNIDEQEFAIPLSKSGFTYFRENLLDELTYIDLNTIKYADKVYKECEAIWEQISEN